DGAAVDMIGGSDVDRQPAGAAHVDDALVVQRRVEEAVAAEGPDALEHVDGAIGSVGQNAGDAEGGVGIDVAADNAGQLDGAVVGEGGGDRQDAPANAALALDAQDG